MSTIKFYLDNNSEVVLEDDGKKDLTEDLLSLIKSDNICIIGGKDEAVIIRPTRIVAIKYSLENQDEDLIIEE